MSDPAKQASAITVLYFAGAQAATGIQRERVELPASESGFPLSELGALLAVRHPKGGLADVLQTSQWSVNEELVPSEDVAATRLRGGENVAVIPPVSGG
ncbi:hypothetical protein AURDEDRAFT_59123 [Auricularia subglabra TFB-10046 SS5]|nr:hypothetical protein AURDEDRAFT_59123 [Auricularia subglabra TFB-10046 SS5]